MYFSGYISCSFLFFFRFIYLFFCYTLGIVHAGSLHPLPTEFLCFYMLFSPHISFIVRLFDPSLLGFVSAPSPLPYTYPRAFISLSPPSLYYPQFLFSLSLRNMTRVLMKNERSISRQDNGSSLIGARRTCRVSCIVHARQHHARQHHNLNNTRRPSPMRFAAAVLFCFLRTKNLL